MKKISLSENLYKALLLKAEKGESVNAFLCRHFDIQAYMAPLKAPRPVSESLYIGVERLELRETVLYPWVIDQDTLALSSKGQKALNQGINRAAKKAGIKVNVRGTIKGLEVYRFA